MCTFTETGIKMLDGTEYPFNTQLQFMNKDHRTELESYKTSMLDSFVQSGMIHEINKNVLEMKSILDNFSLHSSTCPINTKSIEDIADSRIKHFHTLKEWIKRNSSGMQLVKWIFVILTGIATLVTKAMEIW